MNKKKIILIILVTILVVFLFIFCFFFIGWAPEAKETKWGVNFSQKHSSALGLDWEKNYTALFDDLGVKHIKLAAHWDLVEPEDGEYNFKDLDWQIDQAREENADILLVVGMKTPRWPECHIPQWAKKLAKDEQQEKILNLLNKIVLRYKKSNTIIGWQVENEPFFPFGDCPWYDDDFFKKEVELVRSLDERPIVVSDSGEGSFWFKAASIGDTVGVTMYRKVWFHNLKMYITYPLPSVFYYRKAWLINKIFNKKVSCVELQTEPWGPSLLYDLPIEEQQKTMNLDQFKKNIEYAKSAGFDEFYLWGAEWWYWMKVKKDNSLIWEESKNLFD